jgi:hypothetical protein
MLGQARLWAMKKIDLSVCLAIERDRRFNWGNLDIPSLEELLGHTGASG